jgi:hypothetical protein
MNLPDGQPIFFDKPPTCKYNVGQRVYAVVTFTDLPDFKQFLKTGKKDDLKSYKGVIHDVSVARVLILGYAYNISYDKEQTQKERDNLVRYVVKVEHSVLNICQAIPILEENKGITSLHHGWIDEWGDLINNSFLKKVGFKLKTEGFVFR